MDHQQNVRKRESTGPLHSVDDWDDAVRERYEGQQIDQAQIPSRHTRMPDAEQGEQEVCEREFRDYEENCPQRVIDFYRENHERQTVAFNREVRERYLPLRHATMTVWEAIEELNKIVDESDPDTEMPQIVHALQAAEAVRADGHPRWFVLVGLIHDLGKVLTLFGEPQWAVVGDTFPVGCPYSKTIVFPQFFAGNPDVGNPQYQSGLGIYEAECGLDRVMMSWGHDEYLYHVVKEQLPLEALYVIRYHSFYPWHREGAYRLLTNELDRKALEWVQRFNQYDLYTKTDEPIDVESLLPFYQELVEEFLPGKLRW